MQLFNNTITFTNSTGQTGLSIQGGAPTFNGGVDLNVTGTGFTRIFTTNSTVNLPVITGTTTSFYFFGNPTAPIENYVSSTSASSFTTSDGVYIWRSGFTCQVANCLGADSNVVTVGGADTDANNAYLEFDLSGLVFDNTVVYDDTGVLVGPSQLIVTDNVELAGGLSILDDMNINVVAGKILTTSGATAVSIDATKTLSINSTSFTGGALMQNEISGDGDIAINNAQLTATGNNNAYNGEFIINDGGIFTGVEWSYGTTVGGVTVNDGGTLRFATTGGTVIEDDIYLQGAGGTYSDSALENSIDTVQINGTVTIDGNTTIRNDEDTDEIIFNGDITGTGDLTFIGDDTNGGITLSGTTPNDYDGVTYIESINVEVAKSDDVVSIPGDAIVTAVPAHTARIFVTTDEQIADDAIITIDSDASAASLIVGFASTETVGSVEGDGIIQLGSSSDLLRVGGGNKSGTYTGQLWSANANIIKVGTGTWNFNGTTYVPSGTISFEVAEGKLSANPTNDSLQTSDIGITGGVLGGSGIIGDVTAYSGNVAPGNSPGCINPAGAFTLGNSSTLNVEIVGSTECTEYDKVIASGVVTLGDSTLNVSQTYTSTTGTVFTILEGSSIVGTFAGLANNATFTSNGRTLRINYNATNVTLTDVGAALGASNLGDTGVNIQTALMSVLFVVSAAGALLKRRQLKTNFYRFTR